jgi:twitching motility two-component system response regulator PilG
LKTPVRATEGIAVDEETFIKVMVVDDSATIRRTAQTLLTKEGYAVVTAEDGFDALAKIVDHTPDLVLLDIMMPRLDGYQTCAVVKSNAAFQHIPVIMLSSKDGVFDKARGRLVGSESFVSKPFTRDDLLEVIRQHQPQGVAGST